MKFTNKRQQDCVMAKLRAQKTNPKGYMDKLNGGTVNKKNDSTVSKKTSQILDVAAWSGCFAFPDKCIVIKGVINAYKWYNEQKSLNPRLDTQYENIINDAGKFLLYENMNEFKKYLVKQLICELYNNELIDKISEETGLDIDTLKVFMEVTVSNFYSV